MSSAPPRSEIPTLTDLPLVLSSARLRLRPVTVDDADSYFPITRDPELSTMMTWRPHATIDDTRDWLRAAGQGLGNGTNVTWAIEHDGAVAGAIGLHDFTWAVRAIRCDRAELGYWLAPALWGQGLTSEAVQLVLAWAFETCGLHKLTVGCFEPNVGSRRVIEKAGFRFLCRNEDDVWRDGRWFAHLRYELLASEWADSTRTLRYQRRA